MSVSDTTGESSAPAYSGFRSLTIEVTDDDLKAAMLAKANELRPTFKAPGFRPGKVPAQFIVDRLGAELRGEVFHDLCQERANEAIPERDKESLLARPVIREMDDEPAAQGMRRLLVEYNLLPEVSPLDFESMEFERVDLNLDDDAIRWNLLRDLEQQPLAGDAEAGRVAVAGDYVDLDYALLVQGREFANSEGGEPHRVRASAEAEEDAASRRVIGMTSGGSFSQSHVFPADAEDPRLRGAKGEYRFTVRHVRPPLAPEVDERLALATGLDSVESLIEKRRTFLEGFAKAEERKFLHTQLYRKLSEVEAETDSRQETSVAQRIRRAGLSGAPEEGPDKNGDTDADETSEEGLTPEDLARARRIVRYQVVLAILVRRLGISVDNEDLPRALVGWTADTADPSYRYLLARAVRSLQGDPFLRRQAQYEAAAERLLDAILPRIQAIERKMSLEELESRIEQEGREWLIARALG